MDTPRPPAVDGFPPPIAVDCFRIIWWSQRGYWHGAQKKNLLVRHRVFSMMLALAWWPALPILVPLQFMLIVRRRARYYMAPERDVVLALLATRTGWHVEDHIAARPGTGCGYALRSRLLPKLLPTADTHQIAIYTTAATDELAKNYMAELPGLVYVGPGVPRGRLLRRPSSGVLSP